MKRFQHHPDGHVVVQNEAALYSASLADFAADLATLALDPYPGIAADQSGELYLADKVKHPGDPSKEVTRLHAGFSGDSQHAPSLKCDLLDKYIARADVLVEAQAKRVAEALAAARKKVADEVEARIASVQAQQQRERETLEAEAKANMAKRAKEMAAGVAVIAVVGLLGLLAFFSPTDGFAGGIDAQKIAEIRSNGSESLWAFLSRLPSSFEAQIFYGLFLSGLAGALASWSWKWSQGQAGTEHFTRQYVLGQLLWLAGSAIGLITTLGFQDPSGQFLGWMYVVVTGGFAGFAGDVKIKTTRDAWTDEQRAVAAKAALGGNG